MPFSSVARPMPTVGGHTELVREWETGTEPWATIVVVHGLGEHSGRYERTGGLLAESGLRVRAFDLIGFGSSGGRRADIEDWSLWLDQLEAHVAAASEGDLPVALLGHSLGGLIVVDYLLSERHHPHAAVLSAPALEGGRAWQRVLAPLLGAVLPRLPVPNRIRGDQLSRDPEVGRAYFSDPLVTTKSTARLGAQIFATMDRVRRHLDRLAVPTLVLHGGADTLVPARASVPLAGLPSVERLLYPKLRHELFNEPEGPRVIAEMVDWLKGRLTGGVAGS